MSAAGPPQGGGQRAAPGGSAAAPAARAGVLSALHERALTFDCCGERLVGVLAEPMQPVDVGLVIVVGGPQYRIGSHRQFVLLARNLAAAGIAVLRYDYRGMGDATGPIRSFEDTGPDIEAAIGALQAACPSVSRIVLWGLCDAASSALIYGSTAADRRVAGLVIANPWVRSDATLAKTQLKHYYGRRVLEREFWAKLVRGDLDIAGAITTLAGKVATARGHERVSGASVGEVFQDCMAEGLRTFSGPILLLLSGRDLTAKEFLEYAHSSPRWSGLLDRPNIERRHIADADHTFSTARWRGEVETRTLDWLRRTLAPGRP